MERMLPSEQYIKEKEAEIFFEDKPCSVVALNNALNYFNKNDALVNMELGTKESGYLSLNGMKEAVSELFENEFEYFTRKKRYSLRKYSEEVGFKGAYIVCVVGHYLFVDNDNYYSYFWNNTDQIVAIWKLTKIK